MFRKQRYGLRLFIEKISTRERIFVLVAIFSMVLLAAQGLMYVTNLNNHTAILDRIAQKKMETQRVEKALLDSLAALDNPKIMALQKSVNNLQENIDRLEKLINNINEKLMSPDRMTNLLSELLDKQANLTITQFSVLPIKTIQSNIDGGALFYEHGLSIEMEGSFEAVSSYLEEIESLSDQIFWDDIVIETKKFPTLGITLKVHTLSQDEKWLNV